MTSAAWHETVNDLNARILSAFSLPPFTLVPAPLMCPVCGTTRFICLLRFSRDQYHENQIRAALRRDEAFK